ncbi:hypothetical protein JKG47_00420 [Acidithiobacillus sp. MC6.1]|nr:hypothetical protein [Acidithiobacillus sp. MC6.1]
MSFLLSEGVSPLVPQTGIHGMYLCFATLKVATITESAREDLLLDVVFIQLQC